MTPASNLAFTDSELTVSKDSRGRLPLGSVAEWSKYRVSKAPTGELLLTPVVEIPARELWIWNNPQVLESIDKGFAQIAGGDTVPLEDAIGMDGALGDSADEEGDTGEASS
jgi:hypothetical protein